jgi:NADH:ubiquinone oxidoreductase subunit 5 (subunit L)/multisubunit Na+/H+ antiporter MnhA subunit
MYLLVIFLPFFSFFILVFFGNFFSRNFCAKLATFFMSFSCLYSIFIFYEVVVCQSITVITLKE